MIKNPTAGVILAAGESKRFGQPKQLVKLKGKYLIEWVIDAALNSLLEHLILVLGYEYQKILQALEAKAKQPRLQVVVNNKFRLGQSRSLRTGLLKVGDAFPSVMFLLGDQPMLDAKTIDYMLTQFWQSGKNICVPLLKGKRGNPTIFSRLFYDQLLEIQGDIGARKIIQRNPDQVLYVAISDPMCFFDVDSQRDLKNLEALFTENAEPT
jgi:molybdenum cofactor cytidylyltransferase